MYLGIDVGGTKTLVAVLDNQGVIKGQERFPTPEKYTEFLDQLKATLLRFEHQDYKAGGIGQAGSIDRKNGRLISWDKRHWDNSPLQHDLEKITKCPMLVENDAKMGGLSEAMLLKSEFKKVLYVPVGTGIGTALIVDCQIDTSVGDGGGRALMLEYKGKRVSWESFASGRALVERFGKQGQDITDETTWRTYSHSLALGLLELVAVTGPEVIVIGGSVGAYFDRFKKPLQEELHKYALPLLEMPQLRQAQRPETAVLYGCYDLASQAYNHSRYHHG